MALSTCTSRNIFPRHTLRLPFATTLFVLLASCGTNPDARSRTEAQNSSQDELSPIVRRTLSFLDWCGEWKLNCPAGIPVDIPLPNRPWTKEQWQHLLSVAQSFTESPNSAIGLSRSDLEDTRMTYIAQLVGMEPELNRIREHLRNADWRDLTLGEGKPIVVRFDSRAATTLPSALTLNHETEVKLTLADGVMSLTGAALSSQATSTFEPLETLRVEDKNVVEIAGPTMSVSRVPIDFLLEQIIGTPVKPPATKPDPAKAILAAKPLRDLLVAESRRIHLDARFFSTAAASLPKLIDFTWSPETGKSLELMLATMDRADSGWDTGGKELLRAKLKTGKTLKCRIEGAPVVVEIADEVGLTEFGNTETGAAFVEVFGIRTKIDLPGPMDPFFNLTRMEFTDKKITIKNVPVVKEFSMKIPGKNDPSDPNQNTFKGMICSN